jgi:hypothetical protein
VVAGAEFIQGEMALGRCRSLLLRPPEYLTKCILRILIGILMVAGANSSNTLTAALPATATCQEWGYASCGSFSRDLKVGAIQYIFNGDFRFGLKPGYSCQHDPGLKAGAMH